MDVLNCCKIDCLEVNFLVPKLVEHPMRWCPNLGMSSYIVLCSLSLPRWRLEAAVRSCIGTQGRCVTERAPVETSDFKVAARWCEVEGSWAMRGGT